MTDQQEEGWPLGLQPMKNIDVFGSTSFSCSPTSTDSSSDLDTESTGSFFHDKSSTTLGSLIGVSRTTNLSRRSVRRRKRPEAPETTKKTSRTRRTPWCFSFCPKGITTTAAAAAQNPLVKKNVPSLGQLLEVERRAANEHRNSHSPLLYEIELEQQPENYDDSNSLFVNGSIAYIFNPFH